jgi:hypothetical protein
MELEESDVIEAPSTGTITVPEPPRVAYESREIEVGKLKIRPQYQRPLDEARVNRIADSFDDKLAGTIDVAFADGNYWVVDGQHRLAAMRQKGIRTCRALIHYGLTLQDEAHLFARLNSERRAVTPRDLYRAELIGGIERSVKVRDIVEKHDFRIALSTGHRGREIAAVGHLWDLLALGVLDQTLAVIREAWSDAEGTIVDGALEGRIIAAVGRFIKDHEDMPAFQVARYVKVLSRQRPDDLIREARTYQTWRIGSAITLVRWYNFRLQTKLPEPK